MHRINCNEIVSSVRDLGVSAIRGNTLHEDDALAGGSVIDGKQLAWFVPSQPSRISLVTIGVSIVGRKPACWRQVTR